MMRQRVIDQKGSAGPARRRESIRKAPITLDAHQDLVLSLRRDAGLKRPTGNPVKRMQDLALLVVVLMAGGIMAASYLPVKPGSARTFIQATSAP